MSALDTSMTLLPYFATKTQLSSFFTNSRHNNIQFTIDFENNQQIPFLDVSIKRLDNNSISTFIYRKKTFTGLHAIQYCDDLYMGKTKRRLHDRSTREELSNISHCGSHYFNWTRY